jgi:hypothetical protein
VATPENQGEFSNRHISGVFKALSKILKLKTKFNKDLYEPCTYIDYDTGFVNQVMQDML